MKRMYLECPNCGFACCHIGPDDMAEEEVKIIKACPCGAEMVEVEEEIFFAEREEE